jgi:hypothetical protein
MVWDVRTRFVAALGILGILSCGADLSEKNKRNKQGCQIYPHGSHKTGSKIEVTLPLGISGTRVL